MSQVTEDSEPEASRVASLLQRVEAGTRKAPLALTRKCELAAALLWLIDMARLQAEAQAGEQ